jgi:uncharacterized membrane protein YfcA
VIIGLALTGALGGFLSGMFGVGGGIVMVPLLMLVAKMDQRRATATSLLAIVPTSLVSAIVYGVNGEVDVVAGLLIAAGAVMGAPIGSRLLRRLPLDVLRWMLVALLVVVALRLIFFEPGRGGDFEFSPLNVAGLVVLGLFMGVASGLFGIGGGVIAVPALIAVFGMGDLLAKGTSLLAMVPTALSGTIANLRAALVRVKEGLTVGIAAAVASFAGVACAFIVPPSLSGVLFGLFLIAVATQIVWRARRRPARTPTWFYEI